MKTTIILFLMFTGTNTTDFNMETEVNSYPENIEHCEVQFYKEPSQRTFWDQCDPILTLHYIINK